MMNLTPKQEKEWMQQILNRMDNFSLGYVMQVYAEFRGTLKGFVEGESFIDKSFARKIADIVEDVIWLEDLHKGDITKEEFNQKLMDKGKAQAEKQWAAHMKYIENKFHPKRKRRKKTV